MQDRREGSRGGREKTGRPSADRELVTIVFNAYVQEILAVKPASIAICGVRERMGSQTIKISVWAVVMSFLMFTSADADQEGTIDSNQTWERLGPTSAASVYWVGHSLVEVKFTNAWGQHTLMTLLGRLAEERGHQYKMGDHTLWGSSISALWRGKPHSYNRDASEMIARREAFERTAGQYDTLVITEGLPLAPSLKVEYSSYYLRRFYCTLKKANPSARVYLYQTWVHYHANDIHSKFPPVHRFDWRAEMLAQRKVWERLADEATHAKVRSPGLLDRVGWTTTGDGGCSIEDPIFIVPAGQALVALADTLARIGPAKAPKLPSGDPLTIGHMFGNTYVDWPADWPLADGSKDVDPAPILARLTLRDATKPLDDIHASGLGVYFVSLVHYATIYRQSPIGLPAPSDVGDEVARVMQCIAWETVTSDPRSGVLGDGRGCQL